MERQTKAIMIWLVLPLVFLNWLIWQSYLSVKPNFLLHVNFYDVGQGDAVFIKTYLGNQILIDGGPTNKVLTHLGSDMPFFDRELELVILTHAHADHVSGLNDVLRRYKVKKIMMPQVSYRSTIYDEFLSLVKTEGAEIIYARAGQRVFLDSATVLDIYYPFGQIAKQYNNSGYSLESDELNDTSVVGKLSFGKTNVLLTGDAGANIERSLVEVFDLQSEILKVGHHGSRFSTSPKFVEEVSPQYAVIQVGRNNYGHPTAEVLQRLKEHGAVVLRTDVDQTVRFVSDGVNLYKK